MSWHLILNSNDSIHLGWVMFACAISFMSFVQAMGLFQTSAWTRRRDVSHGILIQSWIKFTFNSWICKLSLRFFELSSSKSRVWKTCNLIQMIWLETRNGCCPIIQFLKWTKPWKYFYLLIIHNLERRKMKLLYDKCHLLCCLFLIEKLRHMTATILHFVNGVVKLG